MKNSILQDLINAMKCMPGVGPKSAQRIAYHLLQRDRDGARKMAYTLNEAIEKIGHCVSCRTFSETEKCFICLDETRNNQQLCLVETPANVMSIESTGSFKGKYFVLMGYLSPIDGVGPDELGFDLLEQHFKTQQVRELIFAFSSNIETEATVFYISEMAKKYAIKITRLAQGVPIGGDIEYLDGHTLAHAINQRSNA
ncbi:MAG: recombination protein RecR [Methylococcales bacterium]|jgi:recombination protein RecR|nr:recombination protein RecR [Methylococcales bacterium]MBT7410930.1 recombination protein RecR [Methylococcales bacterium]